MGLPDLSLTSTPGGEGGVSALPSTASEPSSCQAGRWAKLCPLACARVQDCVPTGPFSGRHVLPAHGQEVGQGEVRPPGMEAL